MKHATVRSFLGDYLEGDLPLQERARLEAHLAECPTCSEELRGLRATVSLLRRLPDPEPPPGLAESVMARIEAGETRPRLLRGGFRRAAAPALATALAAGVAGVALLGTPPSQTILPVPDAPLTPERVSEASGAAAGDSSHGLRRPALVRGSPAASVGRRSAFAASGGVAPMPPLMEDLEALVGRAQERSLDLQLERLLRDPAAFLDRMGPRVPSDGFARLAQRAARRGRAEELASRLIATPHPMADSLASRFLAASLAEGYQRRVPAPE